MIASEPTECPYYLITRVSLSVTSLLKKELSAAGVKCVSPAYLGVLWCLWQQEDVKAIELGRCAGLEPSTMTGLLDRMERDGLVRRATDPNDRRAHRIHLTDAGREIRDVAIGIVDKTMERSFDGVSEEQLAELKDVLRRVLANTKGQGGR